MRKRPSFLRFQLVSVGFVRFGLVWFGQVTAEARQREKERERKKERKREREKKREASSPSSWLS